MSCSAKLPVYIVLAGTFFGTKAGNVIFSIYVLGILLSIITGRIFRSTFFRGPDAPFVMELPPYRVPMIKSLLIHMWDRSKIFLKKMGGIILVASMVIWVLSTFPLDITYQNDYDSAVKKIDSQFRAKMSTAADAEKPLLEQKRKDMIRQIISSRRAEKAEKSYMGRLGKALVPIFSPLGIDWRGGVALLSGFAAKEIVVSTMGVLYAIDSKQDSEALKKALLASDMTPLSALAMMAFVLLYLPCLATVATIKRETNSMKWTLFSIAYSTSIAWLIAFFIYQGGKLLGFT
jgi:ferrous iron transport protein B